ncbi:YwmB family TATA-box binding protein [Paenibacillus lignilyticus]|uniref:YwmB family TATA-box binding protein n=1 Tax=Paenibacillus lignilyticus TaxID=1172615 RepID=A0ABS5CJ83_9BACL|nr:YwmB family TATA-box binding protein [Paenibacillus lignilyticus]MBP3965923.1 YwmB family TATA-box binding protein [Paenibacillus lignilyticus]
MATSRPEDNIVPSLRRPKRTPKWGVLTALLVLLAAGLWSANYANNKETPITTGERLRHDLEAVWKWSGSEYKGGMEQANWTFRWDSDSDRKQAEHIAASLGFTLSASMDGSEPVDIMASASNEAGHMKLWIHSKPSQEEQSGDKPFELVLLLNTDPGTSRTAMTEMIDEVERATEGLDLVIHGGFTVRGIPVREGGAARIAALAAAKEMESYNDGHTESITYFSEALQSSVLSGSAKVNLQLAESSAAAGESGELIVGVPLITGDYSLPNN